MPGAGQRPEPGRDPQVEVGRQAPQPAPGPHRGPAGPRAHQLVGQTELGAQGRRPRVGWPRKASGPRSTARPATTAASTRPPSRSVASSTTTSRRRPTRVRAAGQLPRRGQAGDARRRARPPGARRAVTAPRPRRPAAVAHDSGQHGAEGRVGVEGGRTGERRCPLPSAAGPGLDVEVVEDLEVVGHEAHGAHHDGAAPRRRQARPITSQQVGPDPGVRGAARRSARPPPPDAGRRPARRPRPRRWPTRPPGRS